MKIIAKTIPDIFNVGQFDFFILLRGDNYFVSYEVKTEKYLVMYT